MFYFPFRQVKTYQQHKRFILGVRLLVLGLICWALIYLFQLNYAIRSQTCIARERNPRNLRALTRRSDFPLYQTENLGFSSQEEWDQFVYRYTDPVQLKPNLRVFEYGCKAGAFLDSLSRKYEGLEIAGVDTDAELIGIARSRLKGKFWMEGSTYEIRNDSFDAVISFGYIYHLKNSEEIKRVVQEMARIVKPGGSVYLGHNNDLDKEEAMPCTTSQLFVDKKFWRKLANDCDLGDLQIIDEYQMKHRHLDDWRLEHEYDQQSKYRYSVYMKKLRKQILKILT